MKPLITGRLSNPRRREAILLKVASTFCLWLFSHSFSYASSAIEPSYELLVYPEYFAAFPPQLMDRIRTDAQEVSMAYQMTPQHAMTACSNYWILKCKAMEEHGETCLNDRTKTEAEFQAWLKDVHDVYKGISCLQSLRWSREKVRKNPGAYILVD